MKTKVKIFRGDTEDVEAKVQAFLETGVEVVNVTQSCGTRKYEAWMGPGTLRHTEVVSTMVMTIFYRPAKKK